MRPRLAWTRRCVRAPGDNEVSALIYYKVHYKQLFIVSVCLLIRRARRLLCVDGWSGLAKVFRFRCSLRAWDAMTLINWTASWYNSLTNRLLGLSAKKCLIQSIFRVIASNESFMRTFALGDVCGCCDRFYDFWSICTN